MRVGAVVATVVIVVDVVIRARRLVTGGGAAVTVWLLLLSGRHPNWGPVGYSQAMPIRSKRMRVGSGSISLAVSRRCFAVIRNP